MLNVRHPWVFQVSSYFSIWWSSLAFTLSHLNISPALQGKQRAREVQNTMRAIRWWIIFFYTSSVLTNDCREHWKRSCFWIRSLNVCLCLCIFVCVCAFVCEGVNPLCTVFPKDIPYLSRVWANIIFGCIVMRLFGSNPGVYFGILKKKSSLVLILTRQCLMFMTLV